MAKRATRKTTTKKTTKSSASRKRRSPDEIIADLKERIKEVERRASAEELKRSPAIKQALGVVRSIDKALDTAAEEGPGRLRHALADARKPLVEYFAAEGVKLPKARIPRGRKPKPR